MSTPAPRPSLLALLTEAGLFSAWLAALIFVAGWSYADRYFAELGLNPMAVEGMPEQGYWGYAFWVFRDAWLPLFCLLPLSVVVLCWRGAAARWIRALLAPQLAALVVVVAAGGLAGAGYLGASRASVQVRSMFQNHYQDFARVIVWPKKDSELAKLLAQQGDMASKGCLRKILMDRRNLYVYPGYEETRGQHPEIFVMPLSEIAAIQVVANPGLCSL